MLEPILLAILGATLGSFFATVVLRHQEKAAGAAWPHRSHCDACKETLRWWELIPVVSYVGLRGRCACCRTRIPSLHPFAEILTAIVSLSAIIVGGAGELWAALWLGWLLTLLALFDLKHGVLPLPLTLSLLVSGLAYAAWRHTTFPTNELLAAVIGFASLGAIAVGYRVLRGREGLGGGDVLFLAGLGAWIGMSHLAYLVLGAALTGLVEAGLVALSTSRSPRAEDSLPFGPFLALGGWVIFLWQGGVAV